MADLPPGDHSADSANGAIEGQQESVTPASASLQVEQTLPDSEQTLSDNDQTLSEADQTGSDSDQTSSETDQLAADRDQAASDRDLAHGADPVAHEHSQEVRERTTRERAETARQRDLTATARLGAADTRDAIASARDVAALGRDQAADARDIAMTQLDIAEAQFDEAPHDDPVVRAAEARKRAAQLRANAAQQRTLAAEDRQVAAKDREQAAYERLRALVDREALARQVAISETDVLTGARTRRAGLTDLDHEINRCRRTNGQLVVAYIDIIGLKTVNDAEGHLAGDALIKRVVQLITTHLRPYDLTIRVGGDEFVCAMSNMTMADARQRFDTMAAPPYNCAIRTGFAELTPDETAMDLIARADGELIATRNGSRPARAS